MPTEMLKCEYDLPLSINRYRHHRTGQAVHDGGVLVDLSGTRKLTVHPPDGIGCASLAVAERRLGAVRGLLAADATRRLADRWSDTPRSGADGNGHIQHKALQHERTEHVAALAHHPDKRQAEAV